MLDGSENRQFETTAADSTCIPQGQHYSALFIFLQEALHLIASIEKPLAIELQKLLCLFLKSTLTTQGVEGKYSRSGQGGVNINFSSKIYKFSIMKN